jgi:signal peptide peptidase SppA
MRNLLSQLADASGETLLAVDPNRLAADARDGGATPGAGIAVVSLLGSLTPRGLTFFGRTIAPGMDVFRGALGRAAADPNVGAIVLDVNSPGGTYAATPETAEAVRKAGEVKPVIAVVDTLAASAAYFIASQATEVVVTPSGEVGSIGVLSVHLDWSKSLEQDGIKATIIRSRAGKADSNPFEPLTEEALAAIRQSVMEADDDFIRTVAKGRNMSPADVRKLADEAGLARTVSAKRAVQLGMADRIGTMADVLSGLIKSKAPARRRSALAFE